MRARWRRVARATHTLVPRSPCFANAVALYAPALKHSVGVPPAMPQGEATGPLPGARQGLNFQMSAMEPGTASMLVVMYFGSSAPSILSGSKPGARSLAQWSRLGSRVPLPSAALQPTETPWLNLGSAKQLSAFYT